MNGPRNNPGEAIQAEPGTPKVSNTTGNNVHRTIGVTENPFDMVPLLARLEALRRSRR